MRIIVRMGAGLGRRGKPLVILEVGRVMIMQIERKSQDAAFLKNRRHQVAFRYRDRIGIPLFGASEIGSDFFGGFLLGGLPEHFAVKLTAAISCPGFKFWWINIYPVQYLLRLKTKSYFK